MLIEIFGTGCAKCQTLEKHARHAADQAGGGHQVVKVSDYPAIVARGVLSTPALAVDGKVRSQGRVPSVDEILGFIRG